jgi:hypothetical protein
VALLAAAAHSWQLAAAGPFARLALQMGVPPHPAASDATRRLGRG